MWCCRKKTEQAEVVSRIRQGRVLNPAARREISEIIAFKGEVNDRISVNPCTRAMECDVVAHVALRIAGLREPGGGR